MQIHHFIILYRMSCWSQWPRGLRCRSAASWLLGSRVRIPHGAWMFVSCVYILCCSVLFCDGMITRPEESYRVSVCVWKPEKGGQRSILDYKRLWMNEWMNNERPGRMINTSASYAGGLGFKSRSGDRLSWLKFLWFFSVSQGKCWDITLNRPRPFPSISFLIHRITLSTDII
jgi:hypothetical protein